LVIEIARTSQRRDRDIKRQIYAGGNVDEYWIVDHRSRTIEVDRDPAGMRWRTLATYGVGESVSPRSFPDVPLAVVDLLPPHE
jgi:Uma2 family endonuclease